MTTTIMLICVLLSTGQPAKLADTPHPFFTVETAEAALIVEPGMRPVEFDAPTTAVIHVHMTTGSLPIATRMTSIYTMEVATDVHWDSDGVIEFNRKVYPWGVYQFDAWLPTADDPATQTMWINVERPEVRNSPIREIRVRERDNGLLDTIALSDRGGLQLYVDGELQPISPTNDATVEKSSPYAWWEVKASQIPTLRVVASDGTYTERVYHRINPIPDEKPTGTPTPTPTPTPAPTPHIEEIGQHARSVGVLPALPVGEPWRNEFGVVIRRVTDIDALRDQFGAQPAVPEYDGSNGQALYEFGLTNGYSRYPTMTPDGKYMLVFHVNNSRVYVVDPITGEIYWSSSLPGADGLEIGESDNIRIDWRAPNERLLYQRDGSQYLEGCNIDFTDPRREFDFGGPTKMGDDHIVNDWHGDLWPVRMADGRVGHVNLQTEAWAVRLGWDTKQPNAMAGGIAQAWQSFMVNGERHDAPGRNFDGHDGYAYDGADQVWIHATNSEHLWAHNPKTRQSMRLWWNRLSAPGYHIGNMPPDAPGWVLLSTHALPGEGGPLANQIFLIELKELVIDWSTGAVVEGPRIIRVSPTCSRFSRTPSNLHGIMTEPSANANIDRARGNLVIAWRGNRHGEDNLEVHTATVPLEWLAVDAKPTPEPTPTPTPEPTPEPSVEDRVGAIEVELQGIKDRILKLEQGE